MLLNFIIAALPVAEARGGREGREGQRELACLEEWTKRRQELQVACSYDRSALSIAPRVILQSKLLLWCMHVNYGTTLIDGRTVKTLSMTHKTPPLSLIPIPMLQHESTYTHWSLSSLPWRLVEVLGSEFNTVSWPSGDVGGSPVRTVGL